MSEIDRADPGVRAELRYTHGLRRDGRVRGAVVAVAGCLAIAAPAAAESLTGRPGATVGAVVAALLFVAVAAVAWPPELSAAEQQHRRLEAVWHEVRTDAAPHADWERYAAWAEARSGEVEVGFVVCMPVGERLAGAPSPFGWRSVERLDPDDVMAGAERMERLRAEAAELELAARQGWLDGLAEADRLAHETRLREIDDAAEAYEREGVERARRELAEREAIERRSQADALARSLRRP